MKGCAMFAFLGFINVIFAVPAVYSPVSLPPTPTAVAYPSDASPVPYTSASYPSTSTPSSYSTISSEGSTNDSDSGSSSTTHLAKFDNALSGLLGLGTLGTITRLGPYQSLYFENMGVASLSNDLVGITPQSAPNVIAFDVQSSLEGGARIKVDFDDSEVSEFGLTEAYVACIIFSEENAANIASPCSITATAYNDGAQTGVQTLDFELSGGLAGLEVAVHSDMTKFEFGNGFQRIDTVDFVIDGVEDGALLVALLDNLEYVLYDVPADATGNNDGTCDGEGCEQGDGGYGQGESDGANDSDSGDGGDGADEPGRDEPGSYKV